MRMKLLAVLKEREDKVEALRRDAMDEAHRLGVLLRQRFEFETLFVVGSLAAGSFSRRSDIDLVVKGLRTEEFFRAHALLLHECSIDVDLKPYEDLSEAFQADVRKKGIKVG